MHETGSAFTKAALIAKGYQVRIQRLGDMKFDPILWRGYKEDQPLEPDLSQAQQNLLWCNKWVIIYPMWWGSVPALLKGFLDRVLSPGFAFKYHETGPFWDKLLKGRSAELVATSDAPWWWIWLIYRNSDLGMLKNATLQFCGFTPVKTTRISGMRSMTTDERNRSLRKILDKIPTVKIKP